jgi:hypothetical protein
MINLINSQTEKPVLWDPCSLDPDLDLGFLANLDPDPDPGFYLSPGLPRKTFKLFQATGEASGPRNIKSRKFFLDLVGQFCLPGSGSTDPTESGSNPKMKNWEKDEKSGGILPRTAKTDSTS